MAQAVYRVRDRDNAPPLAYDLGVRRADRAIDNPEDVRALLARERVCRLGFAVDGEPYVVPLCYGYDAEKHALVFHTAQEGRKLEFLRVNPRVCFEIDRPMAVRSAGDDACGWGLSFESVIGYGIVVEILSEAEKERALAVLMRQQAGREHPWRFDVKTLTATCVWRLEIESMTGKRSDS